ncbi:MAG: aromatic ring-hydroxylating dioxygenase subunit alpha [Neisseriaceae bacterium]|nr:aromatic ring-hydroxylating dioxygenase subunit alpha [Neisseriaceae bacterium]
MRVTDQIDVAALLAARKEGHSLAPSFYNHEAVFAADLAHIFGKHWVFVGVEPQLPEPGDYFTVDFGPRSVVVIRDDDEGLKAFFNVCRHRGSRLCQQQQGSVGNLICPYHQWTYNLSGELIAAEHMGADFQRDQHGLKPVHVRSLAGLIFICMAEEAPDDFEEVMAHSVPYVLPHDLKNAKVAAQIDIVEAGNWKLTMENNRECYHCVGNHPELTVSLYEYGFGYQPNPLNKEGIEQFYHIMAESQQKWAEMGLPSAEMEELSSRVSGFRLVRLPLDGSGQSETLDTKVASKKLLGGLSEPALGGLSFWTQPNSWHHFMSDHVVSFMVLPISAEQTLVRTIWCVHQDAVEGVDYDVDHLTAVWRATNDQDRRLVENSQLGINQPEYQPGPYSPYTEALVEKFCVWYVARMQQGLA